MSTRRAGRRGQGGITLVEILVALGIASAILAPVGSWMILSITSQAPTAGRFNDAAQARLVETYVTRDVASSELVVVDPDLLPGGAFSDCGASQGDVEVLLNLYELGSEPALVAYGTAAGPFGGTSLYRWTCPPARAGSGPAEDLEVLRDVVVDPATGPEAAAACTRPASPSLEKPCRSVELEATIKSDSVDSGFELGVTATRRSTASSLTGTTGSGFSPLVEIVEVSRSPRSRTANFAVTFDALATDLDGTVDRYAWTADGAAYPSTSGDRSPTFEWDSDGEHRVRLTITDDSGNTADETYSVQFTNQPPVIVSLSAVASGVGGGSPIVGVPGETSYALTATVEDPDSAAPVTTTWQYNGAVILNPGSFVFPVDTEPGQQDFTLVAIDGDGDEVSRVVSVELGSAEPSPTEFSRPIDLSREPPVIEAPDQAALAVSFSFESDPDFSGWQLLDRFGTEIASSGATVFDHTFGSGDGGVFTIRRLRGTAPSIEDIFRVDRPPVAAFTFAQPTSTGQTVSFTNESTDDGAIATHQWNLGFIGWDVTEVSPSRRYDNPGTYNVTLTVTDSDGRTDTTQRTLTVPGAPATPPAPNWVGDRVAIEPIPGVTSYEVTVTHAGSGGCSSTLRRTIGPLGPFEVPGGTNSCADSAVTSATLSVEVNGQWSAPSVGATKP